MEAKSLCKKVASIGSGSADEKQQRTRAIISGAAVGGLFGVYYGYSRKKNILAMGLGGALVGAIITRMFMPK